MKRYYRTDGDYLGKCGCGCQQDIYEAVYRYVSDGRFAYRKPVSYVKGHFHYPSYDLRPAWASTQALMVPLAAELDQAIRQRRLELGLSVKDMAALLGWKSPSTLQRPAGRINVMRSTLERVLDRLYADEGGWVEAEPLWTLVRNRQATWGASDAEMAAMVGTKESRWIGKTTARRVLLNLSSPRRACEYEKGRAA